MVEREKAFSPVLTLFCLLGILEHDQPKWRNRQTRATQTRVPLRIVGSTPTFGTEQENRPQIVGPFFFASYLSINPMPRAAQEQGYNTPWYPSIKERGYALY